MNILLQCFPENKSIPYYIKYSADDHKLKLVEFYKGRSWLVNIIDIDDYMTDIRHYIKDRECEVRLSTGYTYPYLGPYHIIVKPFYLI